MPLLSMRYRPRRVQVVVATTVALAVMVISALVWLGWRMLTFEANALRRQSRAEMLLAGRNALDDFMWSLGATEDALSGVDATTPLSVVRDEHFQPGNIAVVTRGEARGVFLVRLSHNGVETVGPQEGSLSDLTPDEQRAFRETVELLQQEWKTFQESDKSAFNKRVYTSSTLPVLATLDANPDRLVAGVFIGARSITALAFGPTNYFLARAVEATLITDLHQPILRTNVNTTRDVATQDLFVTGMPWRLQLVRVVDDAFFNRPRVYFILELGAIAVLVSFACYMLARGILHEAAVARLQSDFVSAVSHEFRSPLTAMAQLTELLADQRVPDDSRRHVYYQVLHQQTDKLHRLVEDLLDFGPLQSGRHPYEFTHIDLADLVQEALASYRDSSPTAIIQYESSARPIPVQANREGLIRVVRNLVENAVKYSPTGKAVAVETRIENGRAFLRVRDQGMGIPADEHRRIFERFTRGAAAKKACIPGTGIGLAMVAEIVRAHRGNVIVESKVSEGSTFIVSLPLSNLKEHLS